MLLWFPKKDQPAECALRKTKSKTVKKFSCPTQISNRVGGGEKKITTSTPRTWKYIYFYNIYKMSYLFQYVHFAQDVWGRSFSQWSAASPGYIQIFLRKEKTKKVQPKNKPKDKRTKKEKKSSFLSSTSILRPTAPLISTSTLWEICSPQTVGQGENFNLSRSAEAERSLFLSSRWPRRRWPSCHRILSRCICHLLRCRSSGRRTTPSTVERKENRITTEYSKSSFLLCWFSGSQSWTQYFNHKEEKLCDLFSTMWVHSLIQSDYSWISCPTVLQVESADVTLAQGQNINQKSELEKPRLAF